MNEETKEQATTESGPRRLHRSVANRRIAGICGGLAEYLNIDPLVVRLIWFLSIFINGIGLFAYIVAWIVIPENPQPVAGSPAPRSRNSQYVWGTVLIVLGIILLADKLDWHFLVPWRWHYVLPYWFNWGVFVSVFIIVLGVLLILRVNGGSSARSAAIAPPPESPSEITTAPAGQYYEGERKTEEKRLTRVTEGRMIGGVCGGLAKYFNIDPAFVRIGWVLITFFSYVLIGVVTYIVMMIVVPEESPVVKNSAPPIGNAA